MIRVLFPGSARIAALSLALCATPYLGLRLYLAIGMHGSDTEVALPQPWILAGLFAVGVLVPVAGVLWTVRWVLRDRLQYRLSGLLGAYAAFVLLFASSYAIVQASGGGVA